MNDIGDFNDDWLNNLLTPILFGAGFSQEFYEFGHLFACHIWVSCVAYHIQISMVCQFIRNEDGIEVSAADYHKSMQSVSF